MADDSKWLAKVKGEHKTDGNEEEREDDNVSIEAQKKSTNLHTKLRTSARLWVGRVELSCFAWFKLIEAECF
jgi:hypothetical protein